MQLRVHFYDYCRLIRFLPRIKRLVTLMEIEQRLLVRVEPTWIEEKLIRVDPVLSQLVDVRSAFQILQDVIETLLNRFCPIVLRNILLLIMKNYEAVVL